MTTASIIVINWNGAAFLEMCLKALLTQTTVEDEIIVVDNDSIDNSVEFLRSHFPNVKLLCNGRNLGYAGGANVGLQAARGDILILLNPDVEVHAGWLSGLKDAMVDKGVGVAGCKLFYPGEEIIQHAGGIIAFPLATADHYGYGLVDEGQWDQEREVDYVTGAALALRREILGEVGVLDEGFYPAYYEEVDYCFRARKAGYRVVYAPASTATHHEHSTLQEASIQYQRFYHRNRLRFVLKHGGARYFIEDFVPAEMKRLAESVPQHLRHVFSSVYLDAMLDWPKLFLECLAGSEEADDDIVKAVLEALADLRTQVWSD